eukprot:Tamp_12723.p1 GENE.Tamp_12723~~Tamp_12723.p1  ORF type:complete len:143 (-),score=23.03 Tamp_12723:613-1041(-)
MIPRKVVKRCTGVCYVLVIQRNPVLVHRPLKCAHHIIKIVAKAYHVTKHSESEWKTNRKCARVLHTYARVCTQEIVCARAPARVRERASERGREGAREREREREALARFVEDKMDDNLAYHLAQMSSGSCTNSELEESGESL